MYRNSYFYVFCSFLKFSSYIFHSISFSLPLNIIGVFKRKDAYKSHKLRKLNARINKK